MSTNKPRRSFEELKTALANYKKQHEGRANERGVHKQFMDAPNLTRARKIVFPR